MSNYNDCGRCGGEGYTSEYEDGMEVRDACYHCGTTGKVDSETAFEDRFSSLVGHLAGVRVSDWQKDMNSSPDGENVAFMAAENMCSVQAILEDKFYQFKEEIAKELETLSEWVRKDLLEMFEHFTKPKPQVNKSIETGETITAEEAAIENKKYAEVDARHGMPHVETHAKVSVEEQNGPIDDESNEPYDPSDDIPF